MLITPTVDGYSLTAYTSVGELRAPLDTTPVFNVRYGTGGVGPWPSMPIALASSVSSEFSTASSRAPSSKPTFISVRRNDQQPSSSSQTLDILPGSQLSASDESTLSSLSFASSSTQTSSSAILSRQQDQITKPDSSSKANTGELVAAITCGCVAFIVAVIWLVVRRRGRQASRATQAGDAWITETRQMQPHSSYLEL